MDFLLFINNSGVFKKYYISDAADERAARAVIVGQIGKEARFAYWPFVSEPSEDADVIVVASNRIGVEQYYYEHLPEKIKKIAEPACDGGYFIGDIYFE